MQTQFSSIEDAIKYLKISRATFFRHKKEGKITVDPLYIGKRMIYNIYHKAAEHFNPNIESDGPDLSPRLGLV